LENITSNFNGTNPNQTQSRFNDESTIKKENRENTSSKEIPN